MKITPNLYLIEDEVQIIDALVDHDELIKDYNSNQVKTFFDDEDYYLVIYQHDILKKFTMYCVHNYSVNEQEFLRLAGIFQEQIAEGRNFWLMRNAIGKMANIYYMAETLRAFHKKTSPIEDEQYPLN